MSTDGGDVAAIRPCATCGHTANSCSECGGLYGYSNGSVVLPPCIQCRRNRPPIGEEPPPPPTLTTLVVDTSEPMELEPVPDLAGEAFDASGALRVHCHSPLVRVLAEMCHQLDAALADPHVLDNTNDGLMRRLDVRERWRMIATRLEHYIGIDQAKRHEVDDLLKRTKQLLDRNQA